MTTQKNKLIGNCEKTEKTTRIKRGIVEYWMQNPEELGLEESDFAHPNCFACGKIPSENFSEAARSTKETEGLDWNQKTPLQKAHVVPRSLEGVIMNPEISFCSVTSATRNAQLSKIVNWF